LLLFVVVCFCCVTAVGLGRFLILVLMTTTTMNAVQAVPATTGGSATL
jgi:hypothetical protein